MPEDISDSPTIEDEKSPKSATSVYDEDDYDYLTYLQRRLERAKQQRNQTHEEFDGQTYRQFYDTNEEIANTYMDEGANADDVEISAGTVESKLDDILSNINNLNLENEVFIFDKDNNELQDFKIALEDIMDRTEKQEPNTDHVGDEEQRMNRQRELMKQGTVFVQEEWKRVWKTKKKIEGDPMDYDGGFKDPAISWQEEQIKQWEGPSRNMLHGPSVYLGDITQFYMDDQPYWFAVKHMPYEKAREIYGQFDNWEFVRPGDYTDDDGDNTIYNHNWQLTSVKENQVEVIVYQDQPNDEFQVLVNGVPMFPIGYPLSAVTPDGEYNLAKQVYRVNNANFAYGQSFVSSGSIKQVSELIDEMLRLMVLKQRKSFAPPRANLSGRVIPDKVLNPGRISMGIDPSDIPKIDEEGQGVNTGEVRVLQEMNQLINQSTISPIFSGQSPEGTQTATESAELQRQAKMTLGLTIFSMTMLENKLGYLRVENILENWFEKQDKRHIKKEDGDWKTVGSYRTVNRQDATIEGEGKGERQIRMREDLPDSDTVREMERQESQNKDKPVRIMFLNPKKVQEKEFDFYIETNQSERESSPLHKMMFRQKLNDIITLAQIGSKPNVAGLEEHLANVHGVPRDQLFESNQSMNLQQLQQRIQNEGGEESKGSESGQSSQGGQSPMGGQQSGTGSGGGLRNADQIGQSQGQASAQKTMRSPGNTMAGGSGNILGG